MPRRTATKPVRSPRKTAKTATRTSAARGDALERARAELLAIAAELVAPPLIPVDKLVGEGLALAASARKYEKALLKAGLDPSYISCLKPRAQALGLAQAAVANLKRRTRSAAERKLEEKALVLREQLLADGRFALRHDDDALGQLGRISEGEGLDDLVQDLKDLAAFFAKHRAALERIGADPAAKREAALGMASELEGELASRRAGDEEERAALDLRDRAASHLSAAMTEVRATGAYVYRAEPKVLRLFRSAYLAHGRRRRKGLTTAATAPAEG